MTDPTKVHTAHDKAATLAKITAFTCAGLAGLSGRTIKASVEQARQASATRMAKALIMPRFCTTASDRQRGASDHLWAARHA